MYFEKYMTCIDSEQPCSASIHVVLPQYEDVLKKHMKAFYMYILYLPLRNVANHTNNVI